MASGGEDGCKLLRFAMLFCRERLSRMVEAQDLGVQGLLDISPGQPLRLRLIRDILQAADDPDRDFLLKAEEGLSRL